ncbi:MAG: Asp/Glu racemase [Alphaproteobacteria bacterium]
MNKATALQAETSESAPDIGTLPFELGEDIGQRGAIGLVVLDVDSTLEQEYRAILPLDGVSLYVSRIAMGNKVTKETLRAMEGDITTSAAQIHPGRKLDVLAFACTSGTVAIGEARVFERLRKARPGISCTSPMTAGVAGLKRLGCESVALITPYTADITAMMGGFIEDHGISVTTAATFDNTNDAEVARISRSSIREAILSQGAGACDAVFVSCSSLHVLPVIEECEAELSKPVLASNQAMAWHSMRLAGIDDALPGFGRLLMH